MTPVLGQDPSWADKSVRLPFDEMTWSAVNAVISAPWFQRLWIWQEIHAKPETAIMVCGGKYMSWTDFCRAIFRILESESLDKENVDDTSVDIVRNLCSPLDSYGFPTLLELTELAICSDPIDT
jgi:dTDP-4-dehydrorhamnose reductase